MSNSQVPSNTEKLLSSMDASLKALVPPASPPPEHAFSNASYDEIMKHPSSLLRAEYITRFPAEFEKKRSAFDFSKHWSGKK